jgi:hypothetical protein
MTQQCDTMLTMMDMLALAALALAVLSDIMPSLVMT